MIRKIIVSTLVLLMFVATSAFAYSGVPSEREVSIDVSQLAEVIDQRVEKYGLSTSTENINNEFSDLTTEVKNDIVCFSSSSASDFLTVWTELQKEYTRRCISATLRLKDKKGSISANENLKWRWRFTLITLTAIVDFNRLANDIPKGRSKK